MSAITNLTLAPFALLFRQSYAHPWLAIAISTLAGLGAYATGHDNWACLLASFGAYMLIWLDEHRRPAQPATAGELA